MIYTQKLTAELSPRVEILGSSDFPKDLLARKQNLDPVVIFQDLYRTYSRLDLIFLVDRPRAIAGLERRLAGALKTNACYGVFEKYLNRSLLWRRGNQKGLRKISFPLGAQVPTWSWMAYQGEIDYVDVPSGIYGGSSIELYNVEPMQSESDSGLNEYPRHALAAGAWDYDMHKITEVMYDDPQYTETKHQKCVIIGHSPAWKEPQAHYLLLVARSNRKEVWERLGVALAEGTDVFSNGPCKISIW